MGGARCDRDLLALLSPPSLHGVDRGWRVQGVLAARLARLRRVRGHRLELAVDGWSDDEGAAGRGKKPGPTPPTGARKAPSAASSPRRRGSPWASRSTQ